MISTQHKPTSSSQQLNIRDEYAYNLSKKLLSIPAVLTKIFCYALLKGDYKNLNYFKPYNLDIKELELSKAECKSMIQYCIYNDKNIAYNVNCLKKIFETFPLFFQYTEQTREELLETSITMGRQEIFAVFWNNFKDYVSKKSILFISAKMGFIFGAKKIKSEVDQESINEAIKIAKEHQHPVCAKAISGKPITREDYQANQKMLAHNQYLVKSEFLDYMRFAPPLCLTIKDEHALEEQALYFKLFHSHDPNDLKLFLEVCKSFLSSDDYNKYSIIRKYLNLIYRAFELDQETAEQLIQILDFVCQDTQDFYTLASVSLDYTYTYNNKDNKYTYWHKALEAFDKFANPSTAVASSTGYICLLFNLTYTLISERKNPHENLSRYNALLQYCLDDSTRDVSKQSNDIAKALKVIKDYLLYYKFEILLSNAPYEVRECIGAMHSAPLKTSANILYGLQTNKIDISTSQDKILAVINSTKYMHGINPMKLCSENSSTMEKILLDRAYVKVIKQYITACVTQHDYIKAYDVLANAFDSAKESYKSIILDCIKTITRSLVINKLYEDANKYLKEYIELHPQIKGDPRLALMQYYISLKSGDQDTEIECFDIIKCNSDSCQKRAASIKNIISKQNQKKDTQLVDRLYEVEHTEDSMAMIKLLYKKIDKSHMQQKMAEDNKELHIHWHTNKGIYCGTTDTDIVTVQQGDTNYYCVIDKKLSRKLDITQFTSFQSALESGYISRKEGQHGIKLIGNIAELKASGDCRIATDTVYVNQAGQILVIFDSEYNHAGISNIIDCNKKFPSFQKQCIEYCKDCNSSAMTDNISCMGQIPYYFNANENIE